MRVAWYESQGHARDVLITGELETPSPKSGEVLVRLFASGCNPSDVKLRAGARPMGFDRIVPHSDGAGIIQAVGKNVDVNRIGQRVWIWNGQWKRGHGTCAEFIAVPQDQAVELPASVSFAEGACLGIPAMTAYRCVFADGPVEDKSVLVTGGAGTVARYAIQMATLSGATVLTTVSGEEKAAYARAAGAHHVLNYRTDDVASAVLDLTGGVDRIVELEFGANLAVTERVINDSGVIAAYGSAENMAPVLPFYPLMFRNVTLRLVLVYLLSGSARRDTIDGLSGMLASGKLSHSVAETHCLRDVATAHESVEAARKLGSVVVEID